MLLDASASRDPDGTIASYTFEFGDGSAAVTQASPVVSHVYAYGSRVGYAARVSVIDDAGAASDKVVHNVAVTGAPWTQLAYVANSGTDSVSVLNLANRTTLATIPVGEHPINLDVTPDGTEIYVANFGDGTVSVIDTSRNEVTEIVTTGLGPSGIAIAPNGTKAFVSNSGAQSVTPIAVRSHIAGAPIPVGSKPKGVAFTPDSRMAYVANSDASSVTAIDVASETPRSTLAVGTGPTGIAVTPDGSKAYVANYFSRTVTPIDTAADTVGAPISVGMTPVAISVSPSGDKAYVVNQSAGALTPISTAADRAGSPLQIGSSPTAVAFSPDGQEAYSVNYGDSTITPINVATDSPGAAFAAPGAPYAIAMMPNAAPVSALKPVAAAATGSAVTLDATGSFDPDGTLQRYTFDFGDGTAPVAQAAPTITHTYQYGSSIGYAASVQVTDNVGTSSPKAIQHIAVTGQPQAHLAFVANRDAKTVSLVNMSNSRTLTSIRVGSGPAGIALSPDLRTLYVTNAGDATLNAIDTATATVTATAPVGAGPQGIAITPDGSLAYIAGRDANTVTVISLATNAVRHTVDVGPAPRAVAISPDGTKAYVTNAGGDTVSVLNTATDALAGTITVGSHPWAVTASRSGSTVYVANNASNTVSEISAARQQVVRTITVGTGPSGVTLTPDDSRLYVTNTADNTVSAVATATGQASTIAVLPGPTAAASTPDGSGLYVVSANAGVITLLSSTTGSVGPSVSTPSPVAVLALPEGRLRTALSLTAKSITTSAMSAPAPMTATLDPTTATGTVTFSANGTVLGTAAVADGKASLSPTLRLGSYQLTASYGGDAAYDSATTTTPASISVAPVGGAAHTVVPARILDTRNGIGAPKGLAVPAKGKLTLQVTGRGGVPAKDVSAAILNLTVRTSTTSGQLTAYAADTPQPAVATLSFAGNVTTAGLAIVAVSRDGRITIANSSNGPVNLIADACGYFATPLTSLDASGRYNGFVAFRLLDLTKTPVKPGGTVAVRVAGRSSRTGTVPATGASAVILNVTAVNPSGTGYLSVYPSGNARPDTSNLNFTKGVTRSNRVIVGLGPDGNVLVYNSTAAATGLIVDVAGYFTSASSTLGGTTYVPLATPQRLLSSALPANLPRFVKVSGNAGIPATTGQPAPWGWITNVTGSANSAPTAVAVYSQGALPVPADVTIARGQTVSNMSVARIQFGGDYLYNRAGNTSVTLDAFGWFG